MVSLNNQQGRLGGGMSFDDRFTNVNDEIAGENIPLIATTEQPYRVIRTTAFIVLHIILVIAFEAAIVLLPYLCYDRKIESICGNHSPYNIALYIHAAAYLVTAMFDRIYFYYQDRSRQNGYLDFDRQTRNLKRIPLIVISGGNAILVAMIKLLEDYLSSSTGFPQPWHCLALLTSIEVLITLIVLIWYLVRTVKFNRKRARPDAIHDDLLSTFFTPETAANEIGFRDDSYRENVLEKQSDLIRYFRERHDYLSNLVLKMKRQIDQHNNQRARPV